MKTADTEKPATWGGRRGVNQLITENQQGYFDMIYITNQPIKCSVSNNPQGRLAAAITTDCQFGGAL